MNSPQSGMKWRGRRGSVWDRLDRLNLILQLCAGWVAAISDRGPRKRIMNQTQRMSFNEPRHAHLLMFRLR